MTKLLALVTLILFFTACKRNAGHEPEGHTATGFAALADTAVAISPLDSALAALPADSTHCQYIEGEFNVADAMEIVYGLYDQNIECSRWVCKARELPSFAGKATQEGILHTRPAGVFMIEEGRQRRALLLTATLSRERGGWENCHVCAPILGAAMFAEIDGAWFIEALKKDIVEIGAWGTLPPHSLVRLGSSTWGIRFDYSYTAQGTTLGGMLLMAFHHDQFRILADVHTKFSNEDMFMEGEGEGFAYSYDSEVSWVPGENTEVYDMSVHTVGRRPSDGLDGSGPVVPFDEQRYYVLKQDQYVLWDSTLTAM